MRPVVLTTIVLLVVLLDLPDTAAINFGAMCKKYPVSKCPVSLSSGGWNQLGNNRCMKVYLKPQESFYRAEGTCSRTTHRGMTGHLVSIRSNSDWEQVLCAMYRTSKGKYHYWIGLQRVSGYYSLAFMFTDHTLLGFTSWAGGQPDNYMGREKCVEMNYWSWGLWNDEACWRSRPFVCVMQYK